MVSTASAGSSRLSWAPCMLCRRREAPRAVRPGAAEQQAGMQTVGAPHACTCMCSAVSSPDLLICWAVCHIGMCAQGLARACWWQHCASCLGEAARWPAVHDGASVQLTCCDWVMHRRRRDVGGMSSLHKAALLLGLPHEQCVKHCSKTAWLLHKQCVKQGNDNSHSRPV